MAILNVGEVAPDFDLAGCIGEEKHRFKFSDYRGKKNVVIAFFVLAFTPV